MTSSHRGLKLECCSWSCQARVRIQVLAPIRFCLGTLQTVAGAEKLFQIRWGLEGFGLLSFLEALAGGSPQPSAQRHALLSRSVHKTVTIFIRDDELDSCHGIHLYRL